MKQLDQQEKEFISAILVGSIIIFIPFSIMIESTRQPLEEWGKTIIKSNEPDNKWALQLQNGNYTNIYLAILYLIIDFGRPLIIIPFLIPTFKLVQKLGWQIVMPDKWKPYLYLKCKECNQLFSTQTQLKNHKMIMSHNTKKEIK